MLNMQISSNRKQHWPLDIKMNMLDYVLLTLCRDKEIVREQDNFLYSDKAKNIIATEIIQSYGKASEQSDFLGGLMQTDNEMPSYIINALQDMSDINAMKLGKRILSQLIYICVEEDLPGHSAYDNLSIWCDYE